MKIEWILVLAPAIGFTSGFAITLALLKVIG